MDFDTTRTKDSYEKILASFAKHEADILVGTQMIVKGHDFPKVTLVGILAADLSLNASDYRAGERTFQLLTQAVGRAGRGVLGPGNGDPDLSAGSLRHYLCCGSGLRELLSGGNGLSELSGLSAGSPYDGSFGFLERGRKF